MIVPYHIGSFTKMRRILEPRYVYKRGCGTDAWIVLKSCLCVLYVQRFILSFSGNKNIYNTFTRKRQNFRSDSLEFWYYILLSKW